MVSFRDVDFGPEPPDRVLGAWVEGEATNCIVFEKDGCPTIGLRRELEPDLPLKRSRATSPARKSESPSGASG